VSNRTKEIVETIVVVLAILIAYLVANGFVGWVEHWKF
jgi:hypothetical protein